MQIIQDANYYSVKLLIVIEWINQFYYQNYRLNKQLFQIYISKQSVYLKKPIQGIMVKTNEKTKQTTFSAKAVDSVSATQLLKALHTLDNIHMVQQQFDRDLNISFSQKDNFDTTQQFSQHSQKKSQKHSTSQRKSQKTPTLGKNKDNEEIDKTGKINFEFYMSKKQTNQNQNRSKSPIPVPNYNQLKKTFQKPTTPRKQTTATKAYTMRKSTTLLTERSHNTSSILKTNNSIIINKQLRLKTEADQGHTNSKFRPMINNKSTTVKEQKKVVNKDKQNKTQINIENPIKFDKEIKTLKTSQTINQLSMHERNKEFIRLKNQKLAKLTQQMEDKKKEQQKECTFKPKIISNNVNIKSKYNDLCASREFYQKSHKKCRVVKENTENCAEEFSEMYNKNMKVGKNMKHYIQEGQKLQLEMDSTSKSILQHCDSRLNESIPDQEGISSTKAKGKYKNSKFNILLDLIH